MATPNQKRKLSSKCDNDESEQHKKQTTCKVKKEQKQSKFEDLANEICYEVFDYLSCYELLQAFRNLNYRYNSLLTSNLIRMKADLTELSRVSFARHCEVYQPEYSQSLTLSNRNTIKAIHLFNEKVGFSNFFRLQSLVLYQIRREEITEILPHLFSLSLLQRLIITEHEIQRFNMSEALSILTIVFGGEMKYLKTCQLNFNLPTAEEFTRLHLQSSSSIQQLTIKRTISCLDLISFLKLVPNVKYLKVDSIGNPEHLNDHDEQFYLQTDKQNKVEICAITAQFPLTLASLTSIKIVTESSVSFDNIQLLFKSSPQLQRFSLHTGDRGAKLLDGYRWQHSISTLTPNLTIFQFRCYCYDKPLALTLNSFETPFYTTTKQWQFVYNDNNYEFHSIPYPGHRICLSRQESLTTLPRTTYQNVTKLDLNLSTTIDIPFHFSNVKSLTLNSYKYEFNKINLDYEKLTELILCWHGEFAAQLLFQQHQLSNLRKLEVSSTETLVKFVKMKPKQLKEITKFCLRCEFPLEFLDKFQFAFINLEYLDIQIIRPYEDFEGLIEDKRLTNELKHLKFLRLDYTNMHESLPSWERYESEQEENEAEDEYVSRIMEDHVESIVKDSLYQCWEQVPEKKLILIWLD